MSATEMLQSMYTDHREREGERILMKFCEQKHS